MNRIYRVTLEFHCGTSITTAIMQAIAFANNMNVSTQFVFNDVLLVVGTANLSSIKNRISEGETAYFNAYKNGVKEITI